MSNRKNKHKRTGYRNKRNVLARAPIQPTGKLAFSSSNPKNFMLEFAKKYWLLFLLPLLITLLGTVFTHYYEVYNKNEEINKAKVYPIDTSKINIVIAQFSNALLPEANSEHYLEPGLIYSKIIKEIVNDTGLSNLLEVTKLDKYSTVNLQNFRDVAKSRKADILIFGNANEYDGQTSDREIYLYSPDMSKLNDLMIDTLSKGEEDAVYRYETLNKLPLDKLITIRNYNRLYYFIGLSLSYKKRYHAALKYIKKATSEKIQNYEDIIIGRDLVLLQNINDEFDSASIEVNRLLFKMFEYSFIDSNSSFYKNHISIGNLTHIIFNDYCFRRAYITSSDFVTLYYHMIAAYIKAKDRVGLLSAIVHHYYLSKSLFKMYNPTSEMATMTGIFKYKDLFSGVKAHRNTEEFIINEIEFLSTLPVDSVMILQNTRSSIYQLKYAIANAILVLPDKPEFNDLRKGCYIPYNKLMDKYHDPDRFSLYKRYKPMNLYTNSEVVFRQRTTNRMYTREFDFTGL